MAARPPSPHPDFPVGSLARVRPLGPAATPNRRRLAGRVGVVARSSRSAVLVEFEGERFGEQFAPTQLEPVAGPGLHQAGPEL